MLRRLNEPFEPLPQQWGPYPDMLGRLNEPFEPSSEALSNFNWCSCCRRFRAHRCVEECLRPMLPLPPGHGEEGGLPPSPEHEEEEEGEVMLAAMEAVEETVRHHRNYLLAPDRQPPQQA